MSENIVVSVNDNRFKGYKVNSDGFVIGKRGNVMIGCTDKCGYKEVNMVSNGKTINMLVHRIVLSSFRPCDGMEKLDVNHKDGNKSNNKLENLEWCTRSENINHSYKNGLQEVVGNRYGTFKVLKSEDIDKIIDLHKNGLIDREIARIVGCSRELVGRKIRKAGLR